jgi:hypothetical protein
LNYTLPDGVAFNPHNPQDWFNPDLFSGSTNTQEFLQKIFPLDFPNSRNKISLENVLDKLGSIAFGLAKLNI